MQPSGMHYFPLAWPFLLLLTVMLLLLVGFIELEILTYASWRIGIRPRYVFAVLFLSLLGSYVNIPVAQLPPEAWFPMRSWIFTAFATLCRMFITGRQRLSRLTWAVRRSRRHCHCICWRRTDYSCGASWPSRSSLRWFITWRVRSAGSGSASRFLSPRCWPRWLRWH